MKKIMIYGDSNTWGDNFFTGIRIKDEYQWPNILQKKLGQNYLIYQEGLPGRLAGNEEKKKPFKNGKDTFISTFRTHAPLDTLIISLGTNDLQITYNKPSDKIIKDILWFEKELRTSYEDEEDKIKYFNNKFPRIIYILPTNFDYKERANMIFDINSEEKRQQIISYFKNNQDKYEIIIKEDLELFEDGIHYNEKDHQTMANIMYEVIKND